MIGSNAGKKKSKPRYPFDAHHDKTMPMEVCAHAGDHDRMKKSKKGGYQRHGGTPSATARPGSKGCGSKELPTRKSTCSKAKLSTEEYELICRSAAFDNQMETVKWVEKPDGNGWMRKKKARPPKSANMVRG